MSEPVEVDLLQLVDEALGNRLGGRLRLRGGAWPSVRADAVHLRHALEAVSSCLMADAADNQTLTAAVATNAGTATLTIVTATELGLEARSPVEPTLATEGQSTRLLGLYVAEGLLAAGGGSLREVAAAEGPGFRLTLPLGERRVRGIR